jgi:hypothetical protein
MTTAIDTNILGALRNKDDTRNTLARSVLDAALGRAEVQVILGEGGRKAVEKQRPIRSAKPT